MSYENSFLLSLHSKMLRIRLFEESLVDYILRGDIRTPCHLYSGQEAIATGICACLLKEDYIFGNHRSHGHFLAKGGSINEMMAEIFCRQKGCCKGRGGSMHLIDPEVGMMGAAPIVAGTISLAMGAALASSIRKDGRVTVSFFGDGASGEGVLYECLNFAALNKLPIIFACENNLYATHMPLTECRIGNRIHEVGTPFSIKNEQVNGMKVIEVYERTKDAVERCRQGSGPVFLEFQTYRFRGHVGPDDNIQGAHTDIRSKEEVERWRERDPIKTFERFLIEKDVLDESAVNRIKDEIKNEIEEAHAFARESKKPGVEELSAYVFK